MPVRDVAFAFSVLAVVDRGGGRTRPHATRRKGGSTLRARGSRPSVVSPVFLGITALPAVGEGAGGPGHPRVGPRGVRWGPVGSGPLRRLADIRSIVRSSPATHAASGHRSMAHSATAPVAWFRVAGHRDAGSRGSCRQLGP